MPPGVSEKAEAVEQMIKAGASPEMIQHALRGGLDSSLVSRPPKRLLRGSDVLGACQVVETLEEALTILAEMMEHLAIDGNSISELNAGRLTCCAVSATLLQLINKFAEAPFFLTMDDLGGMVADRERDVVDAGPVIRKGDGSTLSLADNEEELPEGMKEARDRALSRPALPKKLDPGDGADKP